MFNMLGMELKFFTANYPQTDGQMERVNALVEDYLRHYVSSSQRNWVDLQNLAQFSYNFHKSSAMGMSPFEMVYGQQPMIPMSVGYQVLLKLTPQIWKKIISKIVYRGLIPKYDGPFEVVNKVGLVGRGETDDSTYPSVIRQEFEKTVLKILDNRMMGRQSKKNRRTDYLIHWTGESEAGATWERDVTLWQFEDKINEYWAVKGVARPTRRLSSSCGGGF
ncbi:UNVERIFIED_CONTAM: hypothetical protein Sradi_6989300 [Sesamum radiatum]|uniref:Uncharacterized protein n=1 Tax=Sesamum radiatum TaxID=300843 RepID=A0AAW2JDI1_SESRA